MADITTLFFLSICGLGASRFAHVELFFKKKGNKVRNGYDPPS